jgi:hypothetical protein
MNNPLSPQLILDNWDEFNGYISKYISSPRKEKLLSFYKKYEDRISIMPAAHKKEYHSAFPGGYIDHVNRVIKGSLKLHDLWEEFGVDTSTYTIEELVFSAINHDLGKMGDEKYEAYIPQTDKWRQDKLGEDYMFNDKLAFASVPDRGLYLLQSHDIKYSFNEMIAIQTHDGLYDEANVKYLKGWNAETKMRTSLPYILHQADLMAARIEFEIEWFPIFKTKGLLINVEPKSKPTTFKPKEKALSSIKSNSLQDILKRI